MGMTIETAITVLGMVEAHGICIEAKDIAVDTMRKYQKIQEIVEHWACCGNPSDSMIAISEVLEDGKDDN